MTCSTIGPCLQQMITAAENFLLSGVRKIDVTPELVTSAAYES